jgi:hypothetical protein
MSNSDVYNQNPEQENEQADRNPLYKGAVIFLIVLVFIGLFVVFFSKKEKIEIEPLISKTNDYTVLFNQKQRMD